jgi:hypothetical protein
LNIFAPAGWARPIIFSRSFVKIETNRRSGDAGGAVSGCARLDEGRALGDFKRPIEEAIQTLERIRALAPAIESESMLTDMTGNLRDGAAVLRRELHRKGAPGAEIAASLLQAERNLHEQIEQWGHQT